MGAQGYLIASALDGVLAQRLVRRVCDNCAQPAEPQIHQQAWLSRYLTAEQTRAAKFVEGAGCTYCNMTGYKGRVGVYELLEIDAPMADAIRRAGLTELERLAAQAKGFTPLVQRALEHALNKVTSIDEVMRSMSGLEEPEGRSSLLDDVLSTASAKANNGAARLTG
jgi:MSHA biogenesis protein MshE